jgi:hypothetical protein
MSAVIIGGTVSHSLPLLDKKEVIGSCITITGVYPFIRYFLIFHFSLPEQTCFYIKLAFAAAFGPFGRLSAGIVGFRPGLGIVGRLSAGIADFRAGGFMLYSSYDFIYRKNEKQKKYYTDSQYSRFFHYAPLSEPSGVQK